MYARNSRYQEAKLEFEKVLRVDHDNNEARLSLAKIFITIGDPAEALPLIRDYIQQVPDNYQAYYAMGIAYFHQGYLKEAARQLQEAVQLKPGSYEVEYSYGSVLSRLGDLQGAIRALRIAENLDPKRSGAPYELSFIFKGEKDSRLAEQEITAFQKAKRWGRNVATAAALDTKANQALQQGNVEGAVQEYRQAISLDPNNAKVHYNLALARKSHARIEKGCHFRHKYL